jgi:hypothetical protein
MAIAAQPANVDPVPQSPTGESTVGDDGPDKHLSFLVPADAERLRAGKPGDEPITTAWELHERYRPAANDCFRDMLVVGWTQGALEVVRQDGVLRSKRITWFVRTEHALFLQRAIEAGDGPAVRIALCDDPAQLPQLVERLTPCWSLVVLDRTLCPPGELHLLGRARYLRAAGNIERVVDDLRHLLSRMDRIPAGIPFQEWRNRYAGQTALCLAAGPSLDRRLAFIRQHMHRCVVIAVDVIQQRLQAEGIKVDFVINVDSVGESINDRLVPPTDPATVFVMPANGHRGMDVKFPRRSYFGHGRLARWILGEHASFQTGTNVGISTLGLAEYLGCTEIVLLGHDLSFSDSDYYSTMVANQVFHNQEELACTRTMRRTVMGNSGKPVTTSYLFEIGIQDLGILLSNAPNITAFNPNITDGIGAKLLNTSALPADWQPRNVGALPRPDSERVLGAGVPTRAEVCARLRKEGDALVKTWSQRPAGTDLLAMADLIWQMPEAALIGDFISPLSMGSIMHLLRLSVLPPSIGTARHRQEVEELFARALKVVNGFIQECLGDDDQPLAGRVERCKRSEKKRHFLLSVASSLIAMPEDSPADAILLPSMCRLLRNQRLAAPDFPLPTPQSSMEALQVVRELGDMVSEAYLVETLCLCALDELAEPLSWARASEILPPRLIPQAGRTKRKRGESIALDATDAVLRLRAGVSGSLSADANLACTWHPCQLHLLKALIACGGPGIDQLQAMLLRRQFELDDQMAALILLHLPDYLRACHLLGGYESTLGEASILAMAHRQMERGEYAAALKFALSIRALSRFRSQALAIACECHLRGGDHAQLAATISLIPDPELSQHWRLRVAAGHVIDAGGIPAAPALPEPALFGQMITDAWRRASLPELRRLQGLLTGPDARGVMTDAAAAQFAEMGKGLAVMIRHLEHAAAATPPI